MMTKLPSGFATAATRLHAGTPSALALSEIGLPPLSKICHATAPPLFHPAPSAKARRIAHWALATATGDWLLAGDAGSDTFPVCRSKRTKKTWLCVSAAASTSDFASDKNALLMGQAAIFHGSEYTISKSSP